MNKEYEWYINGKHVTNLKHKDDADAIIDALDLMKTNVALTALCKENRELRVVKLISPSRETLLEATCR